MGSQQKDCEMNVRVASERFMRWTNKYSKHLAKVKVFVIVWKGAEEFCGQLFSSTKARLSEEVSIDGFGNDWHRRQLGEGISNLARVFEQLHCVRNRIQERIR